MIPGLLLLTLRCVSVQVISFKHPVGVTAEAVCCDPHNGCLYERHWWQGSTYCTLCGETVPT